MPVFTPVDAARHGKRGRAQPPAHFRSSVALVPWSTRREAKQNKILQSMLVSTDWCEAFAWTPTGHPIVALNRRHPFPDAVHRLLHPELEPR